MSSLGEMWGEHAVQAPFCFIACARDEREGFHRTMIGGTILDGLHIEHKKWERWRGTVILIPSIIERARHTVGARGELRLDQMVVGPLSYDLDATDFAARAKKRHDSFWQPTWWPTV